VEATGRHADEAYQHTARAMVSRLESAAGEVRQAPQVAGGPAVPITVTQGDARLASEMLSSASFPALAQALAHPRNLDALACANGISPGVALEFLEGMRAKAQAAKVAADDKGLDGSLTGVVPGLSAVEHSPPGQFVAGVITSTKGAAEFVLHPSQWITAASTLLSTNPYYRELAYHENPVAAQQNATQTSMAILRGTVDYRDWASGNYAKALGELWPLDAKAVSELRSIWKAAPDARPNVAQFYANTADHVFKLPHGGDIGQVVSPYTQFSPREVAAMIQAQPRLAHNALLAGAASALMRYGRPDEQLLGQMTRLPVTPHIVVVPNAPTRFVYHLPPGVSHRVVLPRGSHGG
jgi:hypothetical protein